MSNGDYKSPGERARDIGVAVFLLAVAGLIVFACAQGWPALGDFR